MIGMVMLATATAAGLAWWRVLLLALVLVAPQLTCALMVLVVWRARPGDDVSAALFCEGVASELRAGATLRHALTAAAIGLGISPPDPHVSIEDVAAEVASSFDEVAEELRLTIVTAARAGSGAAGIFDELGSFALAQAEIEHELRVATAPGKATALILVGAPLLFVIGRITSGQASALLSSFQQRVVTLLGLGVFLFGLALASAVVWRARS